MKLRCICMHAAHLLIFYGNRLNVFANCILCAILYDSNFTQQFVAVSMSFRITSRLPAKMTFVIRSLSSILRFSLKNRANVAVNSFILTKSSEKSMKIEEWRERWGDCRSFCCCWKKLENHNKSHGFVQCGTLGKMSGNDGKKTNN